MRISAEADRRFWLHLPPSFPTDDFAGIVEWEDDLRTRYLESRPQATPDELVQVRDLARSAQRELLPTSSFGLQFWPMPAPVAVTVEVEVGAPLADESAQLEALLSGIPLALPPSVDAISAPHLGDGVIARFIAAGDEQNPPAGIGVFVSGEGVGVRLLSRATSTTMVGLIEGPLRELVETLRLRD